LHRQLPVVKTDASGASALGVRQFQQRGPRPAARLDAANDKLQMLALSIRVRDDLFADVIANTANGDMATHEALILAMIESLTYPPS
jgi:hypothetical protein